MFAKRTRAALTTISRRCSSLSAHPADAGQNAGEGRAHACSRLAELQIPTGKSSSAAGGAGYRSQRLIRKLHALQYPGEAPGSALRELRRRVCTQFFNLLENGVDARELHRHLLVRGADNRLSSARSSLSGQPTAMSARDDRLLDRLQSHEEPDVGMDAADFARMAAGGEDAKAGAQDLKAQGMDLFSRFHEVGALMPLRAKFTMNYHYSSFMSDAEDRIEVIKQQVEEAIVAVDPSLKRKMPKFVKYLLKSLVPAFSRPHFVHPKCRCTSAGHARTKPRCGRSTRSSQDDHSALWVELSRVTPSASATELSVTSRDTG